MTQLVRGAAFAAAVLAVVTNGRNNMPALGRGGG
jgi:hypothetical protein